MVLYGLNSLGKSTQANILVEKIKSLGRPVQYVKYPIYDLEPTGPRLNEILRSGKIQTMDEYKLQGIYAQNRMNFEPKLKKMLDSGITMVAEDYIGTGLAWGLTKGADLAKLEKQNKGLLAEDIALLLYGKPFSSGKEKNHLHESNDELMRRCGKNYQLLAKQYGWHTVNGNQTIEAVADDIWQVVKSQL